MDTFWTPLSSLQTAKLWTVNNYKVIGKNGKNHLANGLIHIRL